MFERVPKITCVAVPVSVNVGRSKEVVELGKGCGRVFGIHIGLCFGEQVFEHRHFVRCLH
jgi:hypothetical protein